MIESILEKPSAVSRHKQAPLLKEREQFVTYCQQQGTSHKALRNMAAELIAVIRLLRMEKLRKVRLEEIKQAANVWVEEQRSNPKVRSYRKSAGNFVFVASPIPPAPSGARISYDPIVVPGGRGIGGRDYNLRKLSQGTCGPYLGRMTRYTRSAVRALHILDGLSA
jgi:hypothetical protein